MKVSVIHIGRTGAAGVELPTDKTLEGIEAIFNKDGYMSGPVHDPGLAMRSWILVSLTPARVRFRFRFRLEVPQKGKLTRV